MTVEALTDREGKQQHTGMQKEVMLRCESLPPNDNEHYNKLPPVGRPHMLVTEQAVDRALHSEPVREAPGPDKLSFGAIRLVWNWDEERIMRLTRAAMSMGRHPVV